MELKRVVVTGLGAVTPLGLNVDETWEALLNGVSGAGPITHFDASQFKTQFACEVKISTLHFISIKKRCANSTDTRNLLLLQQKKLSEIRL